MKKIILTILSIFLVTLTFSQTKSSLLCINKTKYEYKTITFTDAQLGKTKPSLKTKRQYITSVILMGAGEIILIKGAVDNNKGVMMAGNMVILTGLCFNLSAWSTWNQKKK